MPQISFFMAEPEFAIGDHVTIRNNGTGAFGPYRDTIAEVVNVNGYVHIDRIGPTGNIGRLISAGWKYDVKLHDGNVWEHDLGYGTLERVQEVPADDHD